MERRLWADADSGGLDASADSIATFSEDSHSCFVPPPRMYTHHTWYLTVMVWSVLVSGLGLCNGNYMLRFHRIFCFFHSLYSM